MLRPRFEIPSRLVLAVLLATASNALATASDKADVEAVPAESAWATCIDRSGGTNLEWGKCTGAEVDREDRILNATWKRVSALADGKTRVDLIAEQRAWLKYKEVSCNMWANGDWGRQGQVLSWGMCRAGVIATRVQELREIGCALAQGDSEDLCPTPTPKR